MSNTTVTKRDKPNNKRKPRNGYRKKSLSNDTMWIKPTKSLEISTSASAKPLLKPISKSTSKPKLKSKLRSKSKSKLKLVTSNKPILSPSKTKTKTTTTGYNIDIFKNKSKASEYKCKICENVCKNPVELACIDDHETSSSNDTDSTNSNDSDINEHDHFLSDDHDVLYCQSCLKLHLSQNNNSCPINPKLHENTHFNQARNIRKQINELTVYCYNNKLANNTNDNKENENNNNEGELGSGCEWNGKLSKLSAHFKQCKYNKLYCQICDKLCNDNNIKEHNKIYMLQHIDILFSKSKLGKNNINIHNNPDCDQISELTTDLKKKWDELNKENIFLKKEIKSIRTEFNEFKILYNVESTKKDLQFQSQCDSLKKQIKCQQETVELLQKQHEQLMTKTKDQTELINSLQCEINKSYENDDVDELEIIDEENTKNSANSNLLQNDKPSLPSVPGPGMLKRTSSMKFFHPKGFEKYHPGSIKYEMYHPSKCVDVWVTKTIGNMVKIQRYPCCGSAADGSMYLMEAESDKKWDESLFICIDNKKEQDKLPNYWFKNIHLGCKKNKIKSIYKCCGGKIKSIGCKKRYKCCKVDVDKKNEGCQIGWSC